jgi:hypothetical protein
MLLPELFPMPDNQRGKLAYKDQASNVPRAVVVVCPNICIGCFCGLPAKHV